MNPRPDESPHRPYYREPGPLPKHPSHLKPPEEIRPVPPLHHLSPQPLKVRGQQFIQHLEHSRGGAGFIKSILIGSLFAVIVGLILKNFQIRIEVILPVLAPIWVGLISLIYSILRER